MKQGLSVNYLAWNLVQKLCQRADYYGLIVEKLESGTTIVDAGIRAKGGFQAGKLITEICMGGCGKAEITHQKYGEIELPSIFVYSDHPVIATLGSQFAGWQIKEEDYFAIGSGPARALALRPKEIYEKIDYKDDFDKAIVVLETDKYPPTKLVRCLAEECEVSPEDLSLILTPTASVAGATQIAGRVVETGIHKLSILGLDPKSIQEAWGSAPIPPIHPEFTHSMARTNDAILYGGTTYYTVDCINEQELEHIINEAPSKASEAYGKPFIEIFRMADYDFYKIDPNLFAPAVLIVNNLKTGRIFKAGEVNPKILRQSLNL